MHRQDRLRSPGDTTGDGFRSKVERVRIDVHEYRPRPDPRNRPSRCEKRERRRDDLVVRPDTKRHQRRQQSITSRRHTDSKIYSAKRRYLFLERGYFRTEDEMLRITNAVD